MQFKRTDCHRPGSIVPAHYEVALMYSLSSMESGQRVPSWQFDCVMEGSYSYEQGGKTVYVTGKHCSQDGTCCLMAMRARTDIQWAATGGTGACSVCGANFKHGAIWQHRPTGEYLHMGHDCSDKYEMLMDRSDHELALGRLRRAAAVECQKQLNAEARAKFLEKNSGLEAAFQVEHRIIDDIRERFQRFCSISDKQVALVLKIAREASQPKPVEEVHVPAPTGRVDFVGEIVSVKSVETEFGPTQKMVVKVREAGGIWLAYMTVPSSVRYEERQRGCLLSITATLSAGKDPHFAFGKRPNAATVVEGPALPAATKPIRKTRRKAVVAEQVA